MKKLLAALAGAMVAGVGIGALSRLLMRAVTLAADAAFTAVRWVGVVIASAGVFATIAALPVATLRVVDRLLRSPA